MVIKFINGLVSNCLNEAPPPSGIQVSSQLSAHALCEKGLFILCDGVFSQSSSPAASSCLLIDENCSLVDGLAKKVKASSLLVAEALAVREACSMADICGLVNLVICSDSKVVISLLLSELDPHSEIESIIEDARRIAAHLNLSFEHISRQTNATVNFVVKADAGGSLPINWVSIVPGHLVLLLGRLACS
ncbi:hypothetical protein LguiA_006536 [Lonicera macranthoides]